MYWMGIFKICPEPESNGYETDYPVVTGTRTGYEIVSMNQKSEIQLKIIN